MKKQEKVKCTKCGKTFNKIVSGSSVSSLSFPVYYIQRYEDYNSIPTQIELCVECSSDLDRFLLIEEDGQDYYRNLD